MAIDYIMALDPAGGIKASTTLGVDDTTGQLESTVAIGTTPMLITSTTVVANLNVDQVDGLDAADFLRSNAADALTALITGSASSGINLSAAPYITGLTAPVNAGAPVTTVGAQEGGLCWDSTGDVLYAYDGAAWVTASSGEANTASNQGVAGTSLFYQKSGVDLQFNSIIAASNKVSISLDGVNHEIDVDVTEANFTLDNIGGTLSVNKGGTGLATMGGTGGSILYSTAATTLASLAAGNAGEFLMSNAAAAPSWEAGSLPAVGTAIGDILTWNSTSWVKLGAGANNTVLTAHAPGNALTWTDPGAGYVWNLDGDSGGPTAIDDGETVDFTGGDGINTVVSTSPNLLTISVDPLAVAVTTFVPVTVTPSGVSVNLADIDGTGLAANSTTHLLDIDVTSTVNFTGNAPVWTFDCNTSAEGLFVVGPPLDANHVVNKSYVDSISTGLKWKEPVVVKSQGNIVVAAPGANIDGIAMSAGDRVLMVLQTTTTQDGIWEWNGAAVAMTRSTDAAVSSDFSAAACIVMEGTDAETGWVCTDDEGSAVIGTDDLTMVQFTGAGQLVAGNGITISTNTVSVDPATEVAGSRAAVYVGADGVGVTLDDSTLTHSSSTLAVKADGITTTEIRLSITPTWTGLHTFSHASGIATDNITELTVGAGVDIDDVVLRDGAVHTIRTESGAVLANTPVYADGNGTIAHAEASAVGTARVIGVSPAVITGSGPIAEVGTVSIRFIAGDTPVIGAPVYLDETSAGYACFDVSGHGSGDCITLLGYLTGNGTLNNPTQLDDLGVVDLKIQPPIELT